MLGLCWSLLGFNGKSATYSISGGFLSSFTLAIAQVGSKVGTYLTS